MLQTLKSLNLTRRKKRRCIDGANFGMVIIIGCITFLPKGLTYHSDDPYIVKPTPALQFNKEELTTVLLVNNENHGRFVNIRPDVGLLTSTARTFIQEGVTTEYATQIVGTTLDNGRVYAQYLKKSSRVLYDKKGMPLASVVTSWVGGSLNSDTTLLPQSHNDLFNVDEPNWQDIDDRLLVNRQHFIGRTDYAESLRHKTNYLSSSVKTDGEKHVQGTLESSSLNSLYLSNNNYARKVAINKILPISDLSTYTIKPNYEASVQLNSNDKKSGSYEKIPDNKLIKGFERSPKLIYKKLMRNNIHEMSSISLALKPLIPASQNFATVTYYGFADFTTVVGDSVIVFSPSTSTPNNNLKTHVTSIKGEATLRAEGTNISKLRIPLLDDLSKPILSGMSSEETLLPMVIRTSETNELFSEKIEKETTTSLEASIIKFENKAPLRKDATKILLETSEVQMQLQNKGTSIHSQIITQVESKQLSRPSDEEILRIYNSLVNIQSSGNSNARGDNFEVTESISESSSSDNIINTSNDQIFGGATTIFFEDDTFANLVGAIKSTANVQSNRFNLDVISSVENLEEIRLDQEIFPEIRTDSTINFSAETTLSSILMSIDLIATEKSIEEEATPSSELLPKVFIKEINPNEDKIPSDCISTSQVFLTQLAKTVSNYEKLSNTNDLFESVTETRLPIQPNFEIKEATKYYCIRATSIQSRHIENPQVNNKTSDDIIQQYNQKTYSAEIQGDKEEKVKELKEKKSKEDENFEENITEKIIAEENSRAINQQIKPLIKNRDLESKETHTINGEQDVGKKKEEEEKASAQPDENNASNVEDEEVELIYKTLYTTYTYLTTFFHDVSTSVSSHTEVVTNVMSSTLGVLPSASSSLLNSSKTQLAAMLNENKIYPTNTFNSLINNLKTSNKRYMVPFEVEGLMRTEENLQEENKKSIKVDTTPGSSIQSAEAVATFFTTYTYYTTIFVEGETEIMSHTEVVMNTKRSKATANTRRNKATTTVVTPVKNTTTTTSTIHHNFENLENSITNALNISKIESLANDTTILGPNIPDLGNLSVITIITGERSSSSSSDQQILSKLETKLNSNEPVRQQQQFSLFEDQVSSESNTDTDEIIPSETLLLQTSFTTFTYYTTLYSADKTNVISHLETLTNTVTETLKHLKPVNLEESAAAIPLTYFTTFTYWTKLAKDGQITTLSREETISNIITPTIIQQENTQINNMLRMTSIAHELNDTATILSSDNKENTQNKNVEVSQISQELQYITTTLEPTTYYTTYTYYTTSYQTDKTITYSRFETVTDIIMSTCTFSNNIQALASHLTSLPSHISTVISTTPIQHKNSSDMKTELILYDFKKIIDADGISTIFFTTEIKPTKISDGQITKFISSTSSLLIDEKKQKAQAMVNLSLNYTRMDGQSQKQYKTGLVRLIEGTRIANHTTTLYQSKVIGTVIDHRYAQIIESTSSFIFDKVKSKVQYDANSSDMKTKIISPNEADIQIVNPTETVVTQPSKSAEGVKIEESISEIDTEKKEVDVNENRSKEVEAGNDERLRYPFQAKKSTFSTSPLRTFSNRNRPQLPPKRNSSATIITRSTPTITATPALKTISRISTSRIGTAQAFSTFSKRFSRPIKSSEQRLQSSSTISSLSRNRFILSASSNIRSSFGSSSSRLSGSSRPSLFASSFLSGNSRFRLKPTTSINLDETSSILTHLNSQQDEDDSINETVNYYKNDNGNEEDFTTESKRRQKNPLLRLRRPLNRPQGFTSVKLKSNSTSTVASTRRNQLVGRSRNTTNAVLITSHTSALKPIEKIFQAPLINQNRRQRPTHSLFPTRNIFLTQKPTEAPHQNKRESDDDNEHLNDNSDDSEYEDDDDEEEAEEENNNRRRRSYRKSAVSRKKRAVDAPDQSHKNFRSRLRRPKFTSTTQAEAKNSEKDREDSPEPLISPSQRTRSRFGARYTGHSLLTSTTATTSNSAMAISSNHKTIRPTRPTNSNGVRAQFTLREKDSSPSTYTHTLIQKGLNPVKRPTFRRPKQGSGNSSRQLPSLTATSSTSKLRLRLYTNSGDTNPTSHNSLTTRNRSSSTLSSTSRSRSTGSSRDHTVRGRARNNFNSNIINNNNNDAFKINNSGTITVTHVIPIDVTIPVVSGKLTEYKQVVTEKTSTEVLGPEQYSTIIGSNGFSQLILRREDSSINKNGATEVTQYVLHETHTTTITFTPTTIRGRQTSFSHILPSTAYSVGQVISTVQPQISANAPLANILLSQLLLGNVGLPGNNPLLDALGGSLTQPAIGLGTAIAGPQQPTPPVTEYRTHASTYVTTVFKGQSTVLPITFQGKKILTTVYDTTAQTITATEFITDTIVTTPTVLTQPQPIVNSLLLQQLILQQHLQQQQQATIDPINPLNAILNSTPQQFFLGRDNLQELEVSNTIRGTGLGQPDSLIENDSFVIASSIDSDEKALPVQPQIYKNSRKKSRKNGKNHKRKQNNNLESNSLQSSVVTLYVSGRRPGEFSTVLSTVQVRLDSTQYKRQVHSIDNTADYFSEGSEIINDYLANSPEVIPLNCKPREENLIAYDTEFSKQAPTQSLESIVGDISRWYESQTTITNNFRLTQHSTKIEKQKSCSIVMKIGLSVLNNSINSHSNFFFLN